MLLLAETITGATGISIETIYGLVGTALGLLGLQVAQNRKARAELESHIKELELEMVRTYVRRDVYREQRLPLIRQVNRIEALVELIYRHQRGLPPRPGLPEPELDPDRDENGSRDG